MAITAPSAKRKRKIRWTPYLFIIIPLILYLIWIIGPMLYTFYLSMTDWDGISPNPQFIGLENFATLFGSLGKRVPSAFEYSLINNFKWLIAFTTIPLAMGLGLAVLLNREIRGDRVFKMGIFLPQVLSFAVVALIWAWVYNPRMGLINSFLTSIGVDDTPGWLADKDLATWSIITAASWRQIGYVMILYVAGLKNVDTSLLEAARVDGANAWQSFWKITFPLLAPVTTIVIVISVIDSLRTFDLVQIMTRGGPANSSSVLASLMYIQAFNNYRMGLGAATAVVLFIISFVFIIAYLWRVMQEELEY
ncbi:MAG: sugar ABC transporter permease [Proteobacteria bacterium]|nr:sugar ABC transporter permease [Pseudomonadota bacterium]